MEAEFGKYLEERFPSADKRTSGVIRVHVITLISSAHACPERCMLTLCTRAESSAVLGYLLYIIMLRGLTSFASKLT